MLTLNSLELVQHALAHLIGTVVVGHFLAHQENGLIPAHLLIHGLTQGLAELYLSHQLFFW